MRVIVELNSLKENIDKLVEDKEVNTNKLDKLDGKIKKLTI